MKRKSLFLTWAMLPLLLFFGMTACESVPNEDKPEIEEDPLKEIQYFIAGTVTDAAGEILPGVKVKTDNVEATTNVNGEYILTITSKAKYTLEFSRQGYISIEIDATIANDAGNRSILPVSVKMAKSGVSVTVTPAAGEAIKIGELGRGSAADQSIAALTFPADALPAGTTQLTLTVTPYTIPVSASTIAGTNGVKDMPLIGIDIQSSVTEFVQPISLNVESETGDEANFDDVEVWGFTTTRAADSWSKYDNKATYANSHYGFQTPVGKNGKYPLESKYKFQIKCTQETGAIKNGEVNLVNNQDEIKKDNSGNLSSITGFQITIAAKSGWDYITDPTTALQGKGLTSNALNAMTKLITEALETYESCPKGITTVNQALVTNISGNSILYYKSISRYCEKTYKFKLTVKGSKNQEISVKLKRYIGKTDTYNNATANQHSGGAI